MRILTAWCIVLCTLGCTSQVPQAPVSHERSNGALKPAPTQILFSTVEALELVNSLTESIHISRPENQAWPPALRDRINLCFSNWNSKIWDVRVVPGTSETVLMQSFYEGDQPVLTIAAIRLLVLVRVQGGLALGIDRPSSVTYAIALAHEVVHLERSPEEWKRQRTPQDLFEEEVRTWEIVSREIVRPLIALGEPVEPEMAEIDSILLNRCGDSGRNCPAFRGWLQGGHRKHN